MKITVEVCPVTEDDLGYYRAQNEQLVAILRILQPDGALDSGPPKHNGDSCGENSATIDSPEGRRRE
jgi:hypothetical protein